MRFKKKERLIKEELKFAPLYSKLLLQRSPERTPHRARAFVADPWPLSSSCTGRALGTQSRAFCVITRYEVVRHL